jgi:hypothetical protein
MPWADLVAQPEIKQLHIRVRLLEAKGWKIRILLSSASSADYHFGTYRFPRRFRHDGRGTQSG